MSVKTVVFQYYPFGHPSLISGSESARPFKIPSNATILAAFSGGLPLAALHDNCRDDVCTGRLKIAGAELLPEAEWEALVERVSVG